MLLTHSRCPVFSHKFLTFFFKLLLGDLEDTPLVRSATQTMDVLHDKLQDRDLQIKLKEVQKAAGKGEGKLPIKPVETRCFLCVGLFSQ